MPVASLSLFQTKNRLLESGRFDRIAIGFGKYETI